MPTLWSLLTIVLAVGAGLVAAATLLIAHGIVHPPRMTDAKAVVRLGRLSPGDLGLPFQPVTFTITHPANRRPLAIAGWWIPAERPAGRTVVLLHGYGDAKVGAIAWASLWHERGHDILALDLRAHGESGGSTCTAGFLERHDVAGVIDQLKIARPDATRQLILMGISMGAAVALAVADGRDDIDALVLDSPYADFPAAARRMHHALGIALPRVSPWAIALIERVMEIDFDAIAPLRLIPRSKPPLLLIQCGADELTQGADRRALAVAAERRPVGPGMTRTFPAGHCQALAVDPAGYRQMLDAFLAGLDVPPPGRRP